MDMKAQRCVGTPDFTSTDLEHYPLAILARITRSYMLEVLSQDYIRTAKKGTA